MNITSSKEFERRIAEKVSDGLYTSASEVIRDGLRMLFEKMLLKISNLKYYEKKSRKALSN